MGALVAKPKRSPCATGERLAQKVGCLAIALGQEVRIDLQGGRGILVAEAPGDCPDIVAATDHLRRGKVPKGVEMGIDACRRGDLADVCWRHRCLHRSRQRFMTMVRQRSLHIVDV